MILTGSEIVKEHAAGRLTIEPFDPDSVNPNSYNFHLSPTLLQYDSEVIDAARDNPTRELTIPSDGRVLRSGELYLGATMEVLGGTHYAPTFAARSSVARLGLFINLSACLGDIGYVGHWTLQLVATRALRVYPGMAIGQMMWWCPSGDVELYAGKYQASNGPTPSQSFRDLRCLSAEDAHSITLPAATTRS